MRRVLRKTLRMLIALPFVVALAAQEPPPRYTGEPISLNLKDIELSDFFRLIHEISGLNIVVDPAVRGSLTLVLLDVPWDQALDIVLRNHGLLSELEGNVLRGVLTRETAQKEQEARRDLARATQEAVLLETITYTLSYARAADAAPILRRFLSPRGEIAVDERTNTLILTDVPAVLDQLLGPLSRQEPSPGRSRGQLEERHESDPAQYALALKERSDYTVYSCEVRGEWLHYHTAYGARTRVILAQVDWARTNCVARPAPRLHSNPPPFG